MNQIFGAIEIAPFSGNFVETTYIVQTAIEHLPKICDPQQHINFFLNKKLVYNVNGWEEQILITVDEVIPNACFAQLLRDTTKILSRLSARLRVINCLISVSSDGKQFLFCNPEWILNRELGNWLGNCKKKFSLACKKIYNISKI